ncbi:MAG TPA: permease-like cell division protein FtsX, partial [Polyangiaceae bacterium]|nr:permease-like cell division protein FtsX [Polyangiaceae bacterium]
MLSLSTTRRARRGMMREWRLHALSVFSLAVAFVCLGASVLVVTNLKAAEQRWAHAGRASVYLRDTAHQEDVDALKTALAQVPGVVGVHYVSSGDARAQFGHELDGKSELAALPAEAFPASIELDVAPEMADADLT